ncbi:helix-turn-helix domain-containing protein [Kibdelosporangium persicum]|uniref:HTH-type transcriptional regulator EthR n=1 Tax=Kibdelosporangium persicum TaxID=2698649 RepID=A0ABX2F4S6_9PSEU|nr:helix-turn-helix domain-containing protein [Kibdelosporangium persicum]NRN66005.1 HTH-type transcriptional regulator EthR [Kibdelosporangium persicum]
MTSAETRTERRRRMPRADRERQMMTIAEAVFSERGYAATSMDEIADRVGVSKPMIYEYFGSKEGLLVACIRQVRTELREVTAQAVIGARSPEEALRNGLVSFFRFTDDHRRSWELLLRTETAVVGPAAVAEIETARQEQIQLHIALFSAYMPNAEQRSLEAAAEILVGACERLSVWYVRHDDVTPEEAAEHIMRMTWFGLRSELEHPDDHGA